MEAKVLLFKAALMLLMVSKAADFVVSNVVVRNVNGDFRCCC